MIRKKKYNSFQGQAAEWDAQMALPSYLHKRGAFPPHLPADADWKYPKKNFRKCGDPFVNQFINGRANGPIETLR